MGNSPLVSYTKLSPNTSGKRKHSIDTITIHCVVGHTSLERLGEIFFPTSKAASSNYGIDDKGRVGMYCLEENRSWCSSSPDNDNRAVTIEVASDTTAPYKVTDEALNGTIALCADICRRNSIPRLLWKGDKKLIGQVDQQNMTVHRWFTAKECPGEYLYSRMGYIADEVNKLLGNDPNTPDKQSKILPRKVNDDKFIWDFLKREGLNDFTVAGIMGNLRVESLMFSNNLQNSYSSKLGMTDQQYTENVDSGKYTNFVRDSAGYGLAQWTHWSRKEGLLNYARESGQSIGDLQTQLEYLWKELNQSYKNLLNKFKTVTSVKEASDLFSIEFERPASQSGAPKRAAYGEEFYKRFSKNPPPLFKPYAVQITGSVVNCRTLPGTNNPIVKQVRKGQEHTIVEEGSGTGASKWGRIAEYGWVSLDYCKKR